METKEAVGATEIGVKEVVADATEAVLDEDYVSSDDEVCAAFASYFFVRY